MRLSIERDGFAVVSNAVPHSTLSTLVESLNGFPARRTRAGIRNVLGIPTVHDVATRDTLLHMAKQVLGDYALPFRATLFDKSPHSNWLVVWHQDTALPVREKRELQGWGPWSTKEGVICAHAPASALERILAIRVHLDDSTEENGPLRVLPQTHNLGVLSDEQIHDLASSISAVSCHVARGGILLMRPLLVHASSKARSTMPRRVLHIEYAPSLECDSGLKLAVDDCVIA